MNDNYQRYGPEWEAEITRHPKTSLARMAGKFARDFTATREAAEDLLAALDEIGSRGRFDRGKLARDAAEKFRRKMGADTKDPNQVEMPL